MTNLNITRGEVNELIGLSDVDQTTARALVNKVIAFQAFNVSATLTALAVVPLDLAYDAGEYPPSVVYSDYEYLEIELRFAPTGAAESPAVVSVSAGSYVGTGLSHRFTVRASSFTDRTLLINASSDLAGVLAGELFVKSYSVYIN